MAEQKIDMFKLVEEVEKQKKVDLDEIFNDLDLVKNDKTEETVKVKIPNGKKYTLVEMEKVIAKFTVENKLIVIYDLIRLSSNEI